MKFVSNIRRFAVQIQPRRVRYLLNGAEEEIQPMILAEFKDADLTHEELAFARTQYSDRDNGWKTEIDEVTPTPLINRLSTFDTAEHAEEYEELDQQWGDPSESNPEAKRLGAHTYRELVELKLLTRQGDMVLIEEKKVEAPWPRYAEFQGSFAELAAMVEQVVGADGFDQVIAYERQTLNRAPVLAALEERKAQILEQEKDEGFVAA